MTDRLMLLDSASLYFRAFYGVPDKVRAPDGTPVNAVRGFLDIITKLVTTYEPTHLVACWDDDWRPQWRVDLIPTYKTHRVAQVIEVGPDVEVVPDPLEVQVPIIREVLAALDITVIGAPEHEADDVIGSLATQATGPVDIVTGDRDLFQLVDDASDVRVVYTARGMSNLEVLTDASVVAKYGVLPSQYADFATLRGDASDGLPGVAGIGEKSAATLLAAHGDMAGIVAAAQRGEGMSAGVAAKILAGSAYLEVAPTVVEVVKTLDLGAFDARLHALTDEQRRRTTALADQWALGTAMTRIIDTLDAAASR
ncbi:5'-3' exonuclease [Microbacterium terricola]|uniref:5'-3' exonuclease n=1 Tax=Microbacterium terricola TaxID=344163 RepID=A0ABM8DXV8_9MICO|nr:5'-3' exonuclease [Microbacterium terricola]UYK38869.1 5'-3' exonuclease [Microbacterium terricola]BDV30435.1 5'-3' exonuclease [Microbacterium terricola]